MSGIYSEAGRLAEAILAGDIDVLESLLESGVDPNIAARGRKIPILLAIETGSSECVNRLIAHGSDVHAEDDNGNTPLIVAAMNSGYIYADIVEALLDAGSVVDHQNKYGYTALMATIDDRFADVGIMAVILKRMPDLTLLNSDNRSAKEVAEFFSATSAIELLNAHAESIGLSAKISKSGEDIPVLLF